MSKGNDSTGEVSSRAREGVEGALCDYFASDSLSVEELERRLDRTNRASSMGELRAVLSDLPRGEERFSALMEGASGAVASPGEGYGGGSGLPAHGFSPADLRRLEASRKERDFALAVCGGSVRRGRWIPARRTAALGIWGGVELDFREAILPPGVTEIQVLAIMGGIQIIVAPGTAVDARGFAIMGGFDHMDEIGDSRPGDPDRPLLRIRGVALMGGIDIDVRRPGESAREARRRRRRERRAGRPGDRTLPR